jgi:hypothetical protein
MAGRRAPTATVALVVAAGLVFGIPSVLDVVDGDGRDVPAHRWHGPDAPDTAASPDAMADRGRPSGPAPVGPRARLAGAPAPVMLHIERLGVSASVIAVGVLPDGGMEVPDDVRVVGWYEAGIEPVRPGDPGTAVLAGHRDSRVQGEGALHDLDELHPGDPIEVVHIDGRVSSWQVDELLSTPRDRLPTELLFARDGAPRLALVTCGGSFDRRTRSYSHNTIVVASLVSAPVGD